MKKSKVLEVERVQDSSPENLRDHRARALRQVLRSPKYRNKLVSYKWVMAFFGGLDRFEVARILGRMVEIDTKKKTFLTSARVVDLKTGMPNSGFVKESESMGYSVNDIPEDIFIALMQGSLDSNSVLV